jgi:hypothetical protein
MPSGNPAPCVLSPTITQDIFCNDGARYLSGILGDQIGRLFTLGRFLKMTKVAQIVVPLLSTAQVMHTFLHEMGWATFLAIFFKKSSGHPDGI